jgi:hypothetical protein
MATIISDLINNRPGYHRDLFVDRIHDLNRLRSKILLACNESIIKEPIINIWGVGGIGKTWLLHHIHDLYRNDISKEGQLTDCKTMSALFAFNQSGYDPMIIVHDIFQSYNRQINENADEKYIQDYQFNDIQSCILDIGNMAKKYILILLFDCTESVNQDIWYEIEKTIIEPLVVTGRVIIIIAGRSQVIQWKRFEVRRRVANTEETLMAPFSKQVVAEQLQRRNYTFDIDAIYPYTAGSPLLAEIIAQTLTSQQLVRSEATDQKAAILNCLINLEQHFLENIPAKYKPILDTVIVLRQYGLLALKFMLAKHEEFTSDTVHTDGYYLMILRGMAHETDIVWWQHSKRAYITSDIVRRTRTQRLLLQEPNQFRSYHEYAVHMYRQWAEEEPRASEEYLMECVFHLVSIYQLDQDTEALQQHIDELAQFGLLHLNEERRSTLAQNIATDQESLDLLPASLTSLLFSLVAQLAPGATPLLPQGPEML